MIDVTNSKPESSSVWIVKHGTVGDELTVESVRETPKSARACARQFVPNGVNKMINNVEESLTITWDGHSKIVKTVEVPYER